MNAKGCFCKFRKLTVTSKGFLKVGHIWQRWLGKLGHLGIFSQSNFQLGPFEVDGHPTLQTIITLFSEIKKLFLKEIFTS